MYERLAELIQKLEHDDSDVRGQAALALGKIAAAAAVPALIKTLSSDRDPFVRYSLASALGETGPAAAAAVPTLAAALEEGDVGMRIAAAIALGQIGDPAAIPYLTVASDDEIPAVRKAVAAALDRIKAAPAVSAE